MKRFLEDKLISWSNKTRRKPLILRGARQVGKTHTIKYIGETLFKNDFMIVDFEKRKDLHKLFKEQIDVVDIISQLEVIFSKKIIPGKTLLFFDEIQSCPEALKSLKYFCEELNKLHIIAAGSLLDFALEKISFPVGKVQFMQMFPLTFAEYLFAIQKDQMAEVVLSEPQNLGDVLHQDILRELKNFFFVGGMPEAVYTYAKSQSLQECTEVHEEIVETYIQDFSKYATYSNKDCLEDVFRSVAKNIGRQIKYSHLSDEFSGDTIKKAFNLLKRARVLNKIYSVKGTGSPLSVYLSQKIFKSILLDIGLMHYLCNLKYDSDFLKENLLSIYKGAMAEQFVGQEIRNASNGKLYYWNRQNKSSNAEVDFILEQKDGIVPIEVKSGVSGSLKSMHMFLDIYSESKKGIVFSEAPYSELKEQNLVFIPIYYAFSVAEDKNSNT